MEDSAELIAQLKGYIRFLEELRETDSDVWSAPIGEGKWSIHDIVSHIMMWDKNFLEKNLSRMEAGESVPLKEDSDFQTFNDRAIVLGRKLNKIQLIDKAVRLRTELTTHLSRLPSEAFSTNFQSGNNMTLATFLYQMFVSHDKHHTDQIIGYLSLHHI